MRYLLSLITTMTLTTPALAHNGSQAHDGTLEGLLHVVGQPLLLGMTLASLAGAAMLTRRCGRARSFKR